MKKIKIMLFSICFCMCVGSRAWCKETCVGSEGQCWQQTEQNCPQTYYSGDNGGAVQCTWDSYQNTCAKSSTCLK